MLKLICNVYRVNNIIVVVVKMNRKVNIICDIFIWMFKRSCSLGGRN